MTDRPPAPPETGAMPASPLTSPAEAEVLDAILHTMRDYYRLAHEADNEEQRSGARNEIDGCEDEIHALFAALLADVARLRDAAAALRAIDEMASPAFRVDVEFAGSGQVTLEWLVMAEDGAWETLAQACDADSLAAAVAEAKVQVSSDAARSSSPAVSPLPATGKE